MKDKNKKRRKRKGFMMLWGFLNANEMGMKWGEDEGGGEEEEEEEEEEEILI